MNAKTFFTSTAALIQALVFAVCAGLLSSATSRANANEAPPAKAPGNNASSGALAGTWNVAYENGAVHTYTFDKAGRMSGKTEDVSLAGQIVQKDGRLLLAYSIKDWNCLERLTLRPDHDLTVEHWNPGTGFPANKPDVMGLGHLVPYWQTRPYWECNESAKIGDVAGQWTVVYDNGAVHLYTFDKDGKMQGRDPHQPLSGQIMLKDGRLLLNHFGDQPAAIPPLERLSLRLDGRLVFEHWNPRAGFFAGNKPDAVGVGVPVSGKSDDGVEALDVPMLSALEKIGCSAAALAVGRGGRIYFSRGYGWSDEAHKVPIHPDTPMALASCKKPLAAAMVRQLCRDQNLPLSFTVLPFFKVKPAGTVVDPRVWDITVQHLIDHQAGWQGDPINKACDAYNGNKSPTNVEGILPYVAVQRLAFAPGTKTEYDNFGYQVLDRMVVHLSGRSWVDYLQHSLLRPYGVTDLKWVRGDGPREKGEPPQLWNGLEMFEQPEYRCAVSMPAVCKFMSHFWIDGSVRDKSNPFWIKTGGRDNCTSAMVWRQDGIDVAWAFNGRKWTGVGEDNFDAGEALWKNAVDWLVAEKKIPPK